MMGNTKKENNKFKSYFMKIALNPNNLRTFLTLYRLAATVRRLPGSNQIRKNITSTSSNSTETSETNKHQTYNRLQLKITVLATRQQIFGNGYGRLFYGCIDFQHQIVKKFGVGLLGEQRKWIGYHLYEEKQTGSDFQDIADVLPSLNVTADIKDTASLGRLLQISFNNSASNEEEQSIVLAQDHTLEEQPVLQAQGHTLEEQSIVLAQDHTLEEQPVLQLQDHNLDGQPVLQAQNYNSDEHSFLHVQYNVEEQPHLEARHHNSNEQPLLQPQDFYRLGQSLALPPNDFYHSPARRYFSFRNFPIRDTSLVARLVSSGFFYTGIRDRVQCFHCHGQLENLTSFLQPSILHLRTFRNCGFARQERDFALPKALCTACTTYQPSLQVQPNPQPAWFIASNEENRIESASTQSVMVDLLSTVHHTSSQLRTHSRFYGRVVEQPISGGQVQGDGHIPTAEELRDLSLFPARLPHQNLSFYQRRVSFQGMPALFPQPDHLARAGLYYAGYDDATLCFYCGGGLRCISPNADIYRLHAQHYPECVFIQCMLRSMNQPDDVQVQEHHVVAGSSDINRYREEDVEQIAQIFRCRSCRSRRASILFIPCRHLFLCLDCGIRALICWYCNRRVECLIHVLNQ